MTRFRHTPAADLLDGERPDPDIGSGWGPWQLNAADYTLERRHSDGFDYWIDLDSCDNPAEVLDWIAQIAGKTWADDATLAGLVRALDDTLHLQGNLCPSGQYRTMARAQIREQVRRVAKRRATP